MSALLITGATGFVGIEVLATVLERSERDVIAVVRAPNAEAARHRVDATLALLFGDDAHAYRARVEAVAGDLSSPMLGLTPQRLVELAERTTEIVHCAASVSFVLALDEARAVNVDGARRILELAYRALEHGEPLRRLIHVSTAYVAGTHGATFHERDLDVGQGFRNTYEQSKLEAEQLVAGHADALPAVVVRPSIVVGEHDSGWASAFTALYWPLRAFALGLFGAVPAIGDTSVDVVPVDYVAAAIVSVLDAPAAEGAYHLTAGTAATTVGELAGLASAHFGRERPTFVAPDGFDGADASRAVGGTEAAVLAQSAPYLPYLSTASRFDVARSDALLGARGLRPPRIATYFDRLMEVARATRWGKRPITRADARARGLAMSRAE